MTEEKARHYAKALARHGHNLQRDTQPRSRYLSVQIPSDDCEIFTSVTPPSSVHESQNSATDNPGVVL